MNERSRKLGPRVTVSVTRGDYDILNALADQEDVSVSWVIRRAIHEYLRRHRHSPNPTNSPLATNRTSATDRA
ncbi:MAG: ribbon-helix-helix domain-containing protein [Alphaproteobacteria bacterium]